MALSLKLLEMLGGFDDLFFGISFLHTRSHHYIAMEILSNFWHFILAERSLDQKAMAHIRGRGRYDYFNHPSWLLACALLFP